MWVKSAGSLHYRRQSLLLDFLPFLRVDDDDGLEWIQQAAHHCTQLWCKRPLLAKNPHCIWNCSNRVQRKTVVEELDRSRPWRPHTLSPTDHHSHTHSALFTLCLFESVFMSPITSSVKSTFLCKCFLTGRGSEVIGSPCSTLFARYHHMTGWLMEHALQIGAEWFGYSSPDRALAYAKAPHVFSFVSADKSGIVERWGTSRWTRLLLRQHGSVIIYNSARLRKLFWVSVCVICVLSAICLILLWRLWGGLDGMCKLNLWD